VLDTKGSVNTTNRNQPYNLNKAWQSER